MSVPSPRYVTGRRLLAFKLKLALRLPGYAFRRKKYPLFSLKSLFLYRRQKILEITKAVRLGRHYYIGILRAPHFPSAAFDHMVAKGGLNIPAAGINGRQVRQQINYAILAVSRRCSYACRHCYEHHNLADRESVPLERWRQVMGDLQDIGVGIVVLSGGEPMLRFDDLLELLKSGDKNRSDFHLHTAGHGVTRRKAEALKAAGLTAAAVALDDYDPGRYDRFKGYPGAFREAAAALQHFHRAGILTYTNVCLRKALMGDGALARYLELARDLKVGAISLLEPKPWGQYASRQANELFSEEDRRRVTAFYRAVNHSPRYRDYPYVEYLGYFERPEHLGCLMGGHSHLYINGRGQVQPCVFLPVSFGSIMEEAFPRIFERLRRAVPEPLHLPCPAVSLAATIKGKHPPERKTPIAYDEIAPEWRQMFL
jgi:MoaA/NifB/PqqE/SkfB family radical SAM enzyme